jgi:RNA polymerase sigma factor (sigma-70 family)
MGAFASQLAWLKRILRLRGATREEAEDLVQEAVLRLHVYTQQGGEVRNHEAFLARTAMNLAVDARRHGRVELYEKQPIEDLDLVDLSPRPDEIFAAEQRLLKMKETLDRVSSRTREVFVMHRLQGYSHAEIARSLGITVSAVEKHVASAVTVLAIARQQE